MDEHIHQLNSSGPSHFRTPPVHTDVQHLFRDPRPYRANRTDRLSRLKSVLAVGNWSNSKCKSEENPEFAGVSARHRADASGVYVDLHGSLSEESRKDRSG